MTRPILREATISEDQQYRYDLTRRWGQGGVVCFIMLNPSVADAVRDDNTITKCMEFSKRWGYGAIVVVNQCALRSTDPKVLAVHPDPRGPLNDVAVRTNVATADLVVAAWGATKLGQRLDIQTLANATGQKIFCLGKTKDGYPKHPGRIGYDTPLELFVEPS